MSRALSCGQPWRGLRPCLKHTGWIPQVSQCTSCVARQGRCLTVELEAAHSNLCMPRPVGKEGRESRNAKEKCTSLLCRHGHVANGWATHSENCEVNTQVWTRCFFRWVWEYINLFKNTNKLFLGVQEVHLASGLLEVYINGDIPNIMDYGCWPEMEDCLWEIGSFKIYFLKLPLIILNFFYFE